jgi:hypothetical protein
MGMIRLRPLCRQSYWAAGSAAATSEIEILQLHHIRPICRFGTTGDALQQKRTKTTEQPNSDPCGLGAESLEKAVLLALAEIT